jgi:hypothetical protein
MANVPVLGVTLLMPAPIWTLSFIPSPADRDEGTGYDTSRRPGVFTIIDERGSAREVITVSTDGENASLWLGESGEDFDTHPLDVADSQKLLDALDTYIKAEKPPTTKEEVDGAWLKFTTLAKEIAKRHGQDQG